MFILHNREHIVNQPVWGGQLGSTKLWEEHRNNIQKILNATSDEDFDSNKVSVDDNSQLY